ncbi:hypothetical protein EW146_g4687 [Bondarzewia mesenterica]|uniref:PH domain-containing protein n=1 Tax=Bondarzewia mesenterica TaxID=1095465 RepID=A0A4S4LTW2_9AGAM|nr:hypothetical protein EW146_g4687 [Bondarzewia mesenterica]
MLAQRTHPRVTSPPSRNFTRGERPTLFLSFSHLADPAIVPHILDVPNSVYNEIQISSVLLTDYTEQDLKKSCADGFPLRFDSLLPSFPIISPSSATFVRESNTVYEDFGPPHAPYLRAKTIYPNDKMSKKRRSVQSIFIPSFLHSSPSSPLSPSPPSSATSQARSQSVSSHLVRQISSAASNLSSYTESPSQSPPPDYLLDDDPFANLSPTPFETTSANSVFHDGPSPVRPELSLDSVATVPSPKPRSPLASKSMDSPRSLHSSPSSPTLRASPPFLSDPTSVIPHHSARLRHRRPAHTRPAFASRPSLPSLRTLSQSGVSYSIKARKGTLAARLPSEPWDMDSRSQELEVERDFNSDPNLDRPDLIGTHVNSEYVRGEDGNTELADHADAAGNSFEEASSHALSEEENTPFVQSPISLEQASLHDSSNDMFSSFWDIVSALSSPTHSRSSSASSTSAFSSSAFPPDLQPRSSDDLSASSSSSDHSSHIHARFPSEELEIGVELDPSHHSSDNIANIRTACLSPDPGYTPHNSVYLVPRMPGEFPNFEDFQPGSSAGTVRGTIHSSAGRRISSASNDEDDDWHSTYEDDVSSDIGEEVVDGHDRMDQAREHRDQSGNWQPDRGRGRGDDGGGGREAQDHGAGSTSGAGGNGRNDGGAGRGGRRDRGDDERKGDGHSSTSDSESSEDESEDSTKSAAPGNGSRSRCATTGGPEQDSNNSDDDVPLAQRIPTALTAQRTIRRQVRSENDQRRRERTLRQQERERGLRPSDVRADTSRRPSREPGVVAPHMLNPVSMDVPGSQESTVPASTSRTTRPRTKTLPGNMQSPLALDDLAKRLMVVQASDSPPTAFSRKYMSQVESQNLKNFGPGRAPTDTVASDDMHQQNPTQQRMLRPMKSLHRSRTPESTAPVVSRLHAGHQQLGRSATMSQTGRRDEVQTVTSSALPARASTTDATPRRHKSGRSHQSSDEGSRPGTASTRPSAEHDPSSVRSQRPPIPPLPAAEALNTLSAKVASSGFQVTSRDTKSQMAWQQRVFIGDMQRFNMVEIGSTASAKDILDVLDRQGQLGQWTSSGSWMLYEVAQDFGMERPIRSYEVVADVINSWDKDRTVNTLIAKKTPLAAILHPSVMPTSSPLNSGYVEYESKKGKWNKRWLQLREHSLWLSKRDTGKDETFICSLSNFDAYQVTRSHKSPKPFVFAVKSTDNLNFFENAADYVHIFSCGDKDGQTWLQKILLARSYIINQERNIISSASVGPRAQASASAGGSKLTRAGTRKGQRPTQPLLTVTAPTSATANAVATAAVFEPGSLLAKR